MSLASENNKRAKYPKRYQTPVAQQLEPSGDEMVVHETIREIPVQYHERAVPIQKTRHEEKIVEIPEYEYRSVAVEKVVEVPEVQERIVTREVPVRQHVEKLVPRVVKVTEEVQASRRLPVPLQHVQESAFCLPQLEPKYETAQIPVYAPRFIEFPIPRKYLSPELEKECEELRRRVLSVAAHPAPSMAELENVARVAKQMDIKKKVGDLDLHEVATRMRAKMEEAA